MVKKLRLLAAVPVVTGVMLAATASGAFASTLGQASCVSQAIHEFSSGAPGQAQRWDHSTGFGQEVSYIANAPKDDCACYLNNG